MHIIIHRGCNEIGGTCIELSTEKTTLLLDIGQPLNKESKKLDLSSIKVDAVLISHPHQDHYGLLDAIDVTIPVYIGELAKKLIYSTYIFQRKEVNHNNFKYFKNQVPFNIGDFKITPFLVDHSAVDSYAFLIEADSKRVFYSGDFRTHGRKKRLIKDIIKNPPGNIDILIMEGTMLERSNDTFQNEKAVEIEIFKILKKEPLPCFLLSSSQNIDRIVSAYRASKRAGRIFVVDIYTAWILKEMSMFSDHTPNINWNDIRVLSRGRTAKDHYLTVKNNPEYFKDFIKELFKKRECNYY